MKKTIIKILVYTIILITAVIVLIIRHGDINVIETFKDTWSVAGINKKSIIVSSKEELFMAMTNAAMDIEDNVNITLSGDYTMKQVKKDISHWSYAPYTKGFEWLTTNVSSKKLHIEFQYYMAANVHKKYILKKNVVLSSEEKEIYKVAKDIINKCQDKSEYEKALIIHDQICERAVYTSNNSSNEWSDQEVYYLLVKGQGVCNAYADTMYLLCSMAGLDVKKVIGTATGYQSHAWNQIKIDDQWYEVDVTWDDKEDGYTHEYFNITSEQMGEDHERDNGIYEKCTATTYNYYRQTKKLGQKYVANYSGLLQYLGEERQSASSQTSYEVFVANGYKHEVSLDALMSKRGFYRISASLDSTNKNWFLIKIQFQ